MAADPMFIGTVRNATLKFVNSTGTTAQVLVTLSAQTKVTGLFVTSNDTTSRFVTLLLGDGTTDFIVDSVRIPAGNTSRPIQQINLLDPNRMTWLYYDDPSWDLASGRVIKIRMETAVTSAYETSVFMNYGDLA